MMKKEFIYRSVLESEGAVYQDVRKYLEAAGVREKKIHGIMLAVSEAFNNALLHGNALDPKKIIEVVIAVNDRSIVADIIDEGAGFCAPANHGSYPDPLSEGGRGLALIRSLAEKVQYGRNERTGGTQVSMRFEKEIFDDDHTLTGQMEEKMEFSKRDEGGAVVISLTGRLDLNSGNALKEDIKKTLASGRTSIHLNLRKIEFVNSSGLGALVSIMKDVRIHRGRLTLSDMADYVREIFDITQLSHIFEIYTTEQEALNSYQAVAAN